MVSVGSARATSDALLHRFDTIGSTMDEARALAMAGAPHRSVVTALVQTGGRGRNGRPWISPAGNLYATIVLRPNGEARHAPELGFVVALAVADVVDAVAGPGTALKWPNDVLRDGAKLAGILLERLDGGAVLAGIGINVAYRPEGMPYPVTSLHALGCRVGLDALLDSLVARLDAGWAAWRRHGFAAVVARWRDRGPAMGAPLRVRLGAEIVTGAFAGLGSDGTLLLETAAGRRSLVAGDVLL